MVDKVIPICVLLTFVEQVYKNCAPYIQVYLRIMQLEKCLRMSTFELSEWFIKISHCVW